MPEGPSIVILREQAADFAGRSIVRVEGNTTIEKERLTGRRVEALRSWGKHFLVELDVDFSLRVHLMLFGSWRIDERKSWAVPQRTQENIQSVSRPSRNLCVLCVRLFNGARPAPPLANATPAAAPSPSSSSAAPR